MSCHLVCWSCHLMRCDCLCCVMSRDALRCHVMCAHVKSCHLLCPAMGWNVMRLNCHYSLNNYSVLQSTTPVLQSTTPVLLCTTKYDSSTTTYYSSTTPYYKVLLQYYCVLQSTTPVLQSTTPVLQRTTLYYKVRLLYYSSTTVYYKVLLQYYNVLRQYYKVLLQYYNVLQSTTPVLLCTTKYDSSTQYYSSTSVYYKVLLQYYNVLLQYYSVLQSTTPVLLCTTKYYSSTTKYYSSTTTYYSVLQSTTPVLLQYYCVLQSTTPVLQRTTPVLQSTTPVLQRTTPVLLLSTKYDSSTTLYYKVRLQHPVLLQYYSVLQSTTPVLLCTTKYYSSTTTYYKVLLQYYSVLQSTTPVLLQYYCVLQSTTPVLLWKVIYNARSNRNLPPTSPNTAPAMQNESHIWNVMYNARSNRNLPPTSPNTAPATQKEWQYCSCSHMKRHLQCAEQQESPSNLTKYCACHAKGVSWLICITYETSFTMRRATGINLQPHQILRLPRKIAIPNLWEMYWKQLKWHFQCATDPRPFRPWSDHDPRTIRPRKRKPQPAAPQRLLFALARSRFYWKLQRFPLRLSFQVAPHAAPATKSDTWTSPNNAPATKSDTWTLPNAAPATQKEWQYCSCSHMKRHLQCAEQQESPSNLTKYCACHAKGVSWLICITYETSFTMRGATGINLQPHQILRLPRKIAIPNLREMYWKQLKWHFQCATDPRPFRPWSDHDPRTIRPRKRKPQPAAPQRLLFALARSRFYWKLQRFPLRLSFQISPHAAPATKSHTWTSPNAALATKSDTWTSPNAAPATKSDTK